MGKNTVHTRIQMKNDTEANWNRAINFVPLQGEVIIYSADESHPFSRIKIGDGETTVINLPFIDAQTINGESIEDITSVSKLQHSLTFGAGQEYVFDGSKDVVVPVYSGFYY